MFKRNLIGTAVLSLAAVTAAHANVSSTGVMYHPSSAIFNVLNTQPPTTNVVAAPEIDPATAFSGFTLLAGALAVVRGRRAKK